MALSPAALLAIVSGCGVPDWEVRGGATFGSAWTRLDLEGGRVLWLRAGEGGAPVLVVAQDGRWHIEYTRTSAGWPTAIRLRRVGDATPGAPRTDVTFALDAPEALPALPDGALDIEIPIAARELTMADLRRSRGLTER